MATASASGHSGGSSRFVSLSQTKRILSENGIDWSRADVKRVIDAYGSGDTIDLLSMLEKDGDCVVAKALTGNLAMPNWGEFTANVKSIFKSIRAEVHDGENASYIPVLAEANPETFAVSVCTVDGQEYSYGDMDALFSIQSCVKPLAYAVAVEDRGLKKVHRHVGSEPSGLAFNEVSLNNAKLPHNPMVNAGAISTGSLVGPGMDNAARFRYFMKRLSDFAGGQKIGFSHATYLCEHETAWRNNALVAYMTDAGVFPRDCDPHAALDFYLQCCSIEVNSKIAATIAATLANGGVCPLTGAHVINPVTTKSTLTLMFSCGMYDFSGTWMSRVGLPAKSGVAGLVYIVVPHRMGIAIFSPPLDSHGNSVRGVEFATRLLRVYPFGIFDQIVSGQSTLSLRDAATSGNATGRGGATGSSDKRDKRRAAATTAASATVMVPSITSSTASVGKRSILTLTPLEEDAASVAASELTAATGLPKPPPTPLASPPGMQAKASFRSFAGASATSMHGFSSRDAASSGHKMDVIRRVMLRARRLVRMIRLIRTWCGLPCTLADLARLKVAAARDGDAPEPLQKLLVDSREVPYVADGPEVDVLYSLYVDYRSHVAADGLDDGEAKPSPSMMRQSSSDASVTALEGMAAAGDTELIPSLEVLPVAALKLFIERQGISTGDDNPIVHSLLSRMVASSKDKSSLHFRDMVLPGERNNIIIRALLNQLAMPSFPSFVSELMNIFEAVKRKEHGGEVFTGVAIDEVTKADPEAFGVSVVTVDGQIANIGDTNIEVPLFGTVRPLLYALACKDVGVTEVHRWVMEEPTAADVTTFSLMPAVAAGHGGGGKKAEKEEKHHAAPAAPPVSLDSDGKPFFIPEMDRAPHPRPANPFLDSGALAIASLVGRAHYPSEKRLFHDNGSRFSHMMNEFSRWCGGRRVGFNNSVFLAEKQKRLKTLAISFYLKGMSVYPAVTDPTEAAHYLFQAEAVEMSTSNLAVVAATLANIGVCPLTLERCIAPNVMRSTLSLMYNSGVNFFTGRWMFTVGIPSSAGSSGLTLVIVPGMMGLAIYSPRVNAAYVSPRALLFCEMLTARYRVNIFDQLVYADSNVEISQAQRATQAVTMEQSLMQYELCSAAGAGDVTKVTALIEDGANPNSADYDMRTALHIACSDGQEAVVRLLLEAGANPLVQDRWNCTPYDDAAKRGHHAIVALLDETLASMGIRGGAASSSHKRGMSVTTSDASLKDAPSRGSPANAFLDARRGTSVAVGQTARGSPLAASMKSRSLIAGTGDPAPPRMMARTSERHGTASPRMAGAAAMAADGDVGLSLDDAASPKAGGGPRKAGTPLAHART